MTRLLRYPSILLAVASLSGYSPDAHAAESYDNCSGFITSLPATIGTQGTWCLKQDLSTAISSGNAITINTNNVTIDCNNFKLGGLAAGVGTQANGIFANNLLNSTVRNCNVRGFRYGVLLQGAGGGGHSVEDSRFDGNTFTAILVEGDGSVVRRNRVFDTGGSAFGEATGIITNNSTDVLENTVSGVAASTGSQGNANGIFTNNNNDGTVAGNRVRGLLKDGSGSANGIYNSSSGRVVVHNNDLVGPGNLAIHCQASTGSMRDNVISGFTTTTDNCTDNGGNSVIP
jgi:hypothetical protein